MILSFIELLLNISIFNLVMNWGIFFLYIFVDKFTNLFTQTSQVLYQTVNECPKYYVLTCF